MQKMRYIGAILFLLVMALFTPLAVFAQEAEVKQADTIAEEEELPIRSGITQKKSKQQRQRQIDQYKNANGQENLLRALPAENCLPPVKEANEKKPLSPFEAYVRGQTDSPSLREIDQFGYDLFRCPPSTFAPNNLMPVGPDYLLGPGDQIKMTLWGKVDLDLLETIDSDGKINLPSIGIITLAGLTFSEGKAMLEKELSRYYRASEVKMNVSMGQLRSIRVFAVGAVSRPGSYTLSSFSTLINAIFASGGPTKSGTLRDIQVKRNGKAIVHFDLYDFLLNGNKSQDIRLMPEDVIFIPPVGPLVGIVGHVKNPAIYEIKETMPLKEFIAMAGGLTAIAFEGRVQVQRVGQHQRIGFFEGTIAEIEKEPHKNILLTDGDIVRIFPVREEKNVVILSGAVGMEGEFGVTKGTTRVKDLLEQSGGLLYYAMNEGELTRIKVTQEGPKTEYIKINLKNALAGDLAHNILLEPNDYLRVMSVPEWQVYRKAWISGEVRFPGEYPLAKGDTLRSLIDRAGGFSEKAYLKGAVFTRKSVKVLQKKHLRETIDRLEQRMLLVSIDTAETAISQEAALLKKGAIDQRKELIAKLRAAIPIGRLSLELEPSGSLNASSLDIILEEGDRLSIPALPSSVQVMGAVYNRGSYLYSSKKTVSEYLEKSGGVDQYADDDEIYILRVNGTAMSRRTNDSFFNRFMSSNLDPGDTIVVPEEIDRIAWLRGVKDVVQILYQVAVSTGVLITAFK